MQSEEGCSTKGAWWADGEMKGKAKGFLRDGCLAERERLVLHEREKENKSVATPSFLISSL